ncbi:MAG: hypothetical protein WCB55_04245 [Pseudolabrys sp.]
MRQFLLHAALKRADELNRLRDLPDTPTRSEVEDTTPKVAGLPSNRSDSDPEEAATINETPVVSIPIEIGEPAAVELPAAAARDGARCQEGRAGKTATGTDRRVYRPRHTKVAAKPPQARQYTFFEMFFWGPPSLQPTYGNQPQNSQLPAYAQ